MKNETIFFLLSIYTNYKINFLDVDSGFSEVSLCILYLVLCFSTFMLDLSIHISLYTKIHVDIKSAYSLYRFLQHPGEMNEFYLKAYTPP